MDVAHEQSSKKSLYKHNIIGSDILSNNLKIAQANIDNIYLGNKIQLIHKQFQEFIPPEENGILIVNPPYGERLKKKEMNNFYAMIGERLKHKFAGYQVWLLSGNSEAIKYIGLKPSRRIALLNGSIECTYLNFSMYEGSKKNK